MSTWIARCKKINRQCKIKELLQNPVPWVQKKKKEARAKKEGYITVTKRKT